MVTYCYNKDLKLYFRSLVIFAITAHHTFRCSFYILFPLYIIALYKNDLFKYKNHVIKNNLQRGVELLT